MVYVMHDIPWRGNVNFRRTGKSAVGFIKVLSQNAPLYRTSNYGHKVSTVRQVGIPRFKGNYLPSLMCIRSRGSLECL